MVLRKMPILRTEKDGVRACIEIDISPAGMHVVNVNKIDGPRRHRVITRVAREECETEADVLQCVAEIVMRLRREHRKLGR